MANQFTLLTKKRFFPMFCTQFLGAFNDNLFKQALLLMLTYEGAKQLNFPISLLNNLAALLFILPFFLLSSTAGQLADKLEKSQLTQKIKLFELFIALFASLGFIFKLYPLLFLAILLLGIQSAFFGPIKYSYLPQALKDNELVAGNGLFQTGTSLSILLAMITAGFIVQSSENYTIWLSVGITIVALLGYLASRLVPYTPAPLPTLNINYNLFKTTISTVSYVKQFKSLFFCLIGISWYWFYGATILTQIAEVTKTILNGNQSVVIFILTLFSVGIATGSLLCKTITKGQVSLKLLPIGLTGLSLLAFDLYWALSNYTLVSGASSLSLQQVIDNAESLHIFLDFTLLGLFGGFYIVPLYAYMQAHAPDSHKARVIAANNILNALFMVVSAIFSVIILLVAKLTLPTLFLCVGILNLIIGAIVWLKMQTH